MRAVVISQLYADPANRGKLRALAGLGHAIAAAVPDAWVPTPGGQPLTPEWGDDRGVQIAPIPARGSGARGRWSRATLRRLLSDFRPDIVQIEEPAWSRVAATAAGLTRRLKIPLVLVTRESLPRPRPLLERARRDRTLRTVRGVIGSNRRAAELAVRQRPSLPAVVIPQLGIAAPTLEPRTSAGPFAIGFVGRLVAARGLDLLFDAAMQLGGDWTITVVGTGPAQEELERRAERLGIAARIRWRGALPKADLDQLWAELDCLALPARTTPEWIEATGHAVVQAMAHGVVPVVSDAGALPDLVDDAGMIVSEGDTTALVAALRRLIDETAARRALSAAARQRAMTHYVHDAVARRTADFWSEVVAVAGNGARR